MYDAFFKLVHVRGGPSNVPEVLLEAQSVTIGRSATNRVILHDTKASRYHAEVYRVSSDWLVKDLESANGVRVNGVKVVTRVLAPDDIIAIGDTELRFERCTTADRQKAHATPPLPPPDPAGVTKRPTARTPVLSEAQVAASQDREAIGFLVPSSAGAAAEGAPVSHPPPPPQAPAGASDIGLESTLQPNRLVAPWAQAASAAPGSDSPASEAGLTATPVSSPAPVAPDPVSATLLTGSGRLDLLEAPRPVPTGIELAGMEAFTDFVVRRTVAFLHQPQVPGLPPPSAIAMVGPAGCGKATAAKFAAARWGLLYARLNLTYLLATPLAQWPATLADALGRASASVSAVLAIDDVDALDDRFDALGQEAHRAWNASLELLTAWLRTKNSTPVVFISARDPRKLPPALVTRGEAVDEVFFVDLPGHRERLHLVEHGLKLRNQSSRAVDPDVIVDVTAGYSTAQVQRALEEALFVAHGRDVTTVDLAEAVKRSRPAGQRLGSQLDDLREWARKEARWAT